MDPRTGKTQGPMGAMTMGSSQVISKDYKKINYKKEGKNVYRFNLTNHTKSTVIISDYCSFVMQFTDKMAEVLRKTKLSIKWFLVGL